MTIWENHLPWERMKTAIEIACSLICTPVIMDLENDVGDIYSLYFTNNLYGICPKMIFTKTDQIDIFANSRDRAEARRLSELEMNSLVDFKLNQEEK
jgi:hypothetical protein